MDFSFLPTYVRLRILLRISFVHIFFVLVHPYLSDTFVINRHKVDSLAVVGEWTSTSEHVADSRARRVIHSSATQPDFEAQLVLEIN
jgi:hypothetical protein